MKKAFYLILVLFLAGCGSSVNGRDRRTGNTGEPTPIPTAVVAARPTYEVARGEVIYDTQFPGRVAPTVEQALAFTQDGVIKAVYVRAGQQVQAGDLLAELDTADWEAQLVLAQAALDIAQSQLEASQREIAQTRQEAELRRDLAQLDLDYAAAQAGDTPSAADQYQIDRLTLLLSLAQIDVDRLAETVDPELAAAVDVAALQVAELENTIAQAQLLAPFSGEISALNMAAGRAVTAGQPVGALADPAEIQVTANLREADMQELAEGLPVQIAPSGSPGAALPGQIARLPYPFGSGGDTAVADADPTTTVQFDDMAAALAAYEPGDRVTVRLVITQRDDVLWLPPAAIRDFNGRKFVVVQTDGAEQRVDVTLGIEGNGRVEILDGLAAGQIVVGQ